MTKFRMKLKSLPFVFAILLAVILTFNSNSDPTSFIDRIFRPIVIGAGVFHYSGIIVIFIIYVSLREI